MIVGTTLGLICIADSVRLVASLPGCAAECGRCLAARLIEGGSDNDEIHCVLPVRSCLAPGPGVVAAPSADDILAASDAIRNPGRPFSVTVTLTEFQAGKQVDTSTLTSYSRTQQQGGQFASLIRFVLPARDAGKLMLKNGNDMWFYDPTNKASVRLSPQQRLAGAGLQRRRGDRQSGERLQGHACVGEEEIQDGERRKRKAYKLALDGRGTRGHLRQHRNVGRRREQPADQGTLLMPNRRACSRPSTIAAFSPSLARSARPRP